MKFAKRPSKISKKIPEIIKKRKLIIAAAVAVLIVLYVITRGEDKDSIKLATAEVKDLSLQVSAQGVIKADHETTIHSAVAGRVVWVGADEDDFVKRGQVIAVLDRERFEIAQRIAQQDVIAADAQLVQVYDDISKASGAESFQNRIKRTAAEAAKNKAFDTLKKAQRDLKDATISSPITGTILELNIEPGEEIFPTTEIATVASTQNPEFVAQVDETDINKVALGQTATITIDAFENQTFDSKVEAISAQNVISSTGATVYKVTFKLTILENLKVGMNGEANIEVEKLEAVLTVPVEALIDNKFVYVLNGEQFTKREVETGLQTETEVQIVKGLENGEAVVTSGFDQIEKL